MRLSEQQVIALRDIVAGIRTMAEAAEDFVAIAVEIVSAYVSNNSVAPGGLPVLIANVHGSLVELSTVAIGVDSRR